MAGRDIVFLGTWQHRRVGLPRWSTARRKGGADGDSNGLPVPGDRHVDVVPQYSSLDEELLSPCWRMATGSWQTP